MATADLLRRAHRAAILVVATLAIATACDDSDPVNPDPHPDIHRAVLQVEGGMQITFNRGKIASGTLTLRDGDVVTLSFYGPDGEEEEIANNTERFDLVVNYPSGNPAGLVFTPSAADEYSGTFTRSTPTSTPMIVQFELIHGTGESSHQDGRWNVNVIVE